MPGVRAQTAIASPRVVTMSVRLRVAGGRSSRGGPADLEIPSGKVLGRPSQYASSVNSIYFSLDGNCSWRSCTDGVTSLLDVESGELKERGPAAERLRLFRSARECSALDADRSRNYVRLWNSETGDLFWHQSLATSAAASADGKIAVTSTSDSTQIWDAATAAPVGPALKPMPVPISSIREMHQSLSGALQLSMPTTGVFQGRWRVMPGPLDTAGATDSPGWNSTPMVKPTTSMPPSGEAGTTSFSTAPEKHTSHSGPTVLKRLGTTA